MGCSALLNREACLSYITAKAARGGNQTEWCSWIAGVGLLAVAELAMSSAMVSMAVVSTSVVSVTVTVMVVPVYLLGAAASRGGARVSFCRVVVV